MRSLETIEMFKHYLTPTKMFESLNIDFLLLLKINAKKVLLVFNSPYASHLQSRGELYII